MFKKLNAVIVALAAAVPALAFAGAKSGAAVEINSTSRYARGAMGAARNSKDANQQIGCYISSYPDYNMGFCWAVDASGKTASCRFFDKPQYERILAAIGSDSLIHFNWNATTYDCERIDVQASSTYEPKK